MAHDLFAGRYRPAEKLGAGAMSEVWAAHDEELDRVVALKLLAPDADTERFEREARSVAALGHPNINQVYDYGEAEGRPYMVLEHLPGGTLHERLAAGRPLAGEETRRIAADVASGLAHAHSRGLVHRDLKPANILFDAEDRAKIADFGIARLGGAGTLTEAGTVIGTATTISPEQAAGDAATPASDVYSFGVLLFWMLTGRPPFLSESPMELLELHRRAEPPPVSALEPNAPADLASLAAAALAKDGAARPADGAELLRRLAPASATATIPLAPAVRRAQRRRLPAVALVGLVLAGLAAGGAAVAFGVSGGSGSAPAAPLTTASLDLPTVSTAAVNTVATSTVATEATTATTATARSTPAPSPPPATTQAPATTGIASPATTGLLTTTDLTTTEPPPASPPLQGTTTVGSSP